MNKPCEKFLSRIEANIHDICIGRLILRDLEKNVVLYDLTPPGGFMPTPKIDKDRMLKFQFPKAILKLNSMGSTFEFKIGPVEMKNMRIIQKHFFMGKLLKVYDMEFGYCMPDSVNSWECMLTLPEIPDKEIDEIVKNPWKYTSDTFFFNENHLFLHMMGEYMFLDQ